jgi:hypothetical protein
MAAKLTALVREQWGDSTRQARPFPGGTSLVGHGTAWVLVEDHPVRALGAALLWAQNAGAATLHLLTEDPVAAGILARRAGAFAPRPSVWRIAGRDVVAAEASPLEAPAKVDARTGPFADVLLGTGADVVVEHGVMTGEVLGLEVARVVVDDLGAHLQVGVGKHDRHAQQLVHGDLPTEQVLAQVVHMVAEHRRAGAAPHPYQRLAPERWLRCRVVAEPSLVGAEYLAPVPALAPADDLRKPRAAPAAGIDLQGRPLLAVCSTGFDVDLVPAAVDARLADGRQPRTIVVVPERDDQRALRTLVAALRDPVEVVTVPDDWRRP